MKLYNGKGAILPDVFNIDGKVVATLGDSFSSPGAWQNIVAQNTKCIINNKAKDGGRFSYNANAIGKSAYEQAANLSGNVDIVLMCFGVNDINNNIPFGTFTATNDYMNIDASTVAGGLQKAIGHIQNTYPNAIIKVGWTPAGWCYLSSDKDVDGMTEVIKDVCSRMGVKYIDTLTCGITKYSDSYSGYFEGGSNGGHPLTEGHKAIGEYMTRKILSEF